MWQDDLQMLTKSEVGKYGEELAVLFLKRHGYDILERNYRFKRFEIDLIVKVNNLLVFVEVKTRSKTAFGEPEDAVDQKKASRVIAAADEFIHQNNWYGDIRFDVISITLANKKETVMHFKDAFY